MMQNAPTTIDAYIAEYPPDIQQKLELMRSTIQQAAPEATEAVKYAIPTFVLHGNLVHFAAFTHHIGLAVVGVPANNKRWNECMYMISAMTLLLAGTPTTAKFWSNNRRDS